MSFEQRYIGEILVRRGALEPEKLEGALETAANRSVDLRDLLVATHTVEEDKVVRALADEVGMEFIEKIATEMIPEALIDAVPINFARQNHVLPLTQTDESVRVAIANPLDPFPVDDLRILLGKTIIAVAASEETIDDAINRVYERKDETALADAKEGEEVEELRDLIDMTDEAPVIRWVNNLFYTAVKERASDIHIEPTDEKVIVRYRIDGRLIPRKEANRGFLASIVSRVKIEAGLNIAEKRLPQDGRITKKIAGKVVDVRVSTIPTAKGERVVMRLLDKEQVLLNLIDLGFARRELDQLEHLITRPNGIILVTGPTGSGKTTTLYGCLNKINTAEKNILTAEDPVEYELRGIGQMQVQPKIGLTFASGLRSFLRQDPDVIMVGEIRDHETAEIAIHASLTGHLVLSTLHTNDAPSAITRLVDMDVQPYQISSSVLAVLAQRLVRRLCEICRTPYAPNAQDLRELGIDAASAQEKLAELRRVAATTVLGDRNSSIPALPEPSGNGPSKLTFYRPDGCEECSNTGYRGRIGIFELMIIDEPVRREILNNSDAKTIQRVAQQQGMRLLREDGARQVVAGVTSVEEVLAATQAAEV
ncbi:MAG: type II secretion system ATPase GspE [Deltaproteobacteria bacterium]|jgi:general secretion pathway protein E|nr:type II secretion system ATPase GspE [Deltaproteobacteria bacterium]